jgi:hypothetical protein
MTVCAVAVLLSLVGCATNKVSPPTDQIGDANKALERASQAHANQFAAFEMATADRKLNRARDLARSDQDEDRLEARRLAEQAALDARVAEAKSRLAEARTTNAETRKTLESLRKEIGNDTGGAQ